MKLSNCPLCGSEITCSRGNGIVIWSHKMDNVLSCAVRRLGKTVARCDDNELDIDRTIKHWDSREGIIKDF